VKKYEVKKRILPLRPILLEKLSRRLGIDPGSLDPEILSDLEEYGVQCVELCTAVEKPSGQRVRTVLRDDKWDDVTPEVFDVPHSTRRKR